MAPLLQVTPFGLELVDPRVQVVDLLRALLGSQGLRLEGLEVAVDGGAGLRDLDLDLRDLPGQLWFLGAEAAVGLLPDARHELLVAEHRLDVLQDRALEEIGAHVVLVALLRVPPLAAKVVGELPFLLVRADPDHVALAPRALDDAGEKTLVAIVELPAVHVGRALLHDLLGLLEEDL